MTHTIEWANLTHSGKLLVFPLSSEATDLGEYARATAQVNGATLLSRLHGETLWESSCHCSHMRDDHDEQGRCDSCTDTECNGFVPILPANAWT